MNISPLSPALPVTDQNGAYAPTPGPAIANQTAATGSGDTPAAVSDETIHEETFAEHLDKSAPDDTSSHKPKIVNAGKHHASHSHSHRGKSFRPRLPIPRLRRIFVALNGHARNDEQVEQEFDQFAEEFLNRDFDDRDLEELLQKMGNDPLRGYIILSAIEQKLQARAGEESVRQKLSRLAAVLDRTLRTNRKRIRGGINTADALQLFSELIDERDQLRAIYYDTIVMGPSIRQTLERLLKAFGPEKFRHAVKTLRHAIADDMNAEFPSNNRILLEVYYQGLKEAHIINSLLRSTEDLEKRIGPTTLRNASGMVDFLTHILRYTEGPGNARQLAQIFETVAGKDKEMATDERIQRYVKEFMLKSVPAYLWTSNEIRNTVMAPRPPSPKAAS